MSAIFGIIDFEGRPIEAEWIKSMQKDLAHRGPDRQGLYQETSVFLGHMLLQVTPESVYDTSPYEEAGFVITADARLDERAAIMDRLDIPHVEREIITDPLLLLRSFLKFGNGFVKDIYGDFAFVIWDKEKKELFCARDQMGVKPFLYYFEENRFVFSTELKAIVKLPFVKTVMDHLYNRDYAINFVPDVGRTPWENIIRLKAANVLLVQQSKAVTNQYWDLKYKPSVKYKSEEVAADKLRELLELAISDRMRVIGDIGIPLSGGLDSSAIACLAARKHRALGKKITTASSVLGPDIGAQDVEDEQAYINAVLQEEKNIDPMFVYSSKLSFLKGLDEKFESHYDMVNIFHYVDTAIYEQFQSKSIRRVLSGYAGDHIVSSVIYPLPHLLMAGRFRTFFKMTAKLKHTENLSYLALFKKHILNPTQPFFVRNLRERLHGRVSLWDIKGLPLILTAQEKKTLQLKSKKSIKDYYKFRRNIFLSRWPKYDDPFQEDWDCGASNHSIEMTYPLVDRRVVEFMMVLPIEHFYPSGVKRGLIRKALCDIYPEKIRDRQNKGDYSPDYYHIFLKDIDEFKSQLENPEVRKKLGSIIDLKKLSNLLMSISNSKKSCKFDDEYFLATHISLWLCYTIWSVNK
ncbi:asparagine synthase-related protein [Algibacter mikhailovii]|uniref:asparagine synthase (glutamine-hydrolyzing) n=1 Tax=Algibacter mikhailovii TaxID=425498 RepID=A0A918V783_9FLAO|nr:asparagine synthase-related protein [Algibacter mikhailovii]GGZ75040.1 asparagine synthetase B [Algibacter mikhailovii]